MHLTSRYGRELCEVNAMQCHVFYPRHADVSAVYVLLTV